MQFFPLVFYCTIYILFSIGWHFEFNTVLYITIILWCLFLLLFSIQNAFIFLYSYLWYSWLRMLNNFLSLYIATFDFGSIGVVTFHFQCNLKQIQLFFLSLFLYLYLWCTWLRMSINYSTSYIAFFHFKSICMLNLHFQCNSKEM